MKILTDLKRLLREAKIPYFIQGRRTNKPQLTVSFKPDSMWMDGRITLSYSVTIKFDFETKYVTFSSPEKQLYVRGLDRKLWVSVYCFNIEELITKLDTFGYLTKTDGERIKQLTKDGFGYKRKSKRKVVRKKLSPTLPDTETKAS